MSDDFLRRVRSKFRLDKDNGRIFGVCAGIAAALRTDPTYVRIGAIILALFSWKLVVAIYLIVWLLFDERSVLNNR